MGSCEKCWNDAHTKMLDGVYPTQTEAYHALLKARRNNPCLPKEQAGQWWDEEKQVDSRLISKK